MLFELAFANITVIRIRCTRLRAHDQPHSFAFNSRLCRQHLSNDTRRRQPLCTVCEQEVSPHPVYTQLGASTEERCSVYRDIVDQALDNQDLQAIRGATHYCCPLGGEQFREQLQAELGVPIGRQGRGRPRKQELAVVKE